MKKIPLFLLLTLLYCTISYAQVERIERGNLVIEGIPEIPTEVADRLQQYQNVRSASLSDWLNDSSGVLISTRFGETSQIHKVIMPGGTRQQITFFEEPVNEAAINPDTSQNGFLFTKDVGGSEFYQIFYFDLNSGTYRMLTDGHSRNGGMLWSNAGEHFVYYTTQRNGSDWDLHVYDLERDTSSAILQEGGVWAPLDWSPNDSMLLVGRYVSINESYPYILNLKSGELMPLHQREDTVSYGSALFNADGTGIYYTSDEDSEFQRLRFRDLASGETRILTSDINWDIEGFKLSEDGAYLAFTANEDGYSTLYMMDTESEERFSLPNIPKGVIYGLKFSPDNARLGMVINSPTMPGDVFSYDLATEALIRWTYSEIGGLNEDIFVEPELIRYETFDTVAGNLRTIPAFYYKPEGKGPFPVSLDIHGGPEGQERPSFGSWTQFLVNELGIAVIAPNVRGSSGYGKSYLLLDNAYKRENSVKDIGALLDWVSHQPELDQDQVAVFGGSYGGYMVLAAMTHYNDRLSAGIDVVGISNFVTFLENTQDYRRDLRRAEYGDERDPKMREFLESISPTTNAKKITKPLFVVQGLNDPRVPTSESEQMVEEIRKNGGTVWYLLAKDEGHGFAKKSNRDYFMQAAALFLKKFLLDEDSIEVGSK